MTTLPSGKTENSARPLFAKFKISRKNAEDSYCDWVKKHSFVPTDLDLTSNLDKIKGIYVPIWLFEVSAKSDWWGGYNETHYRTVTNTRYNYEKEHNEDYVDSEPYEVWKPMNGVRTSDYRILVPASKDITQPEIKKGSFELSELQKYDDSYLAEWDVKDWELNYTQASDICRDVLERQRPRNVKGW